MRRTTTTRAVNRHRDGRRGLAPLELVMALPILLFIMGLMVNYSTSTCWKVRTMTAARQGIFRAREGWRGGGDQHLPDWPTNGSIARAGASPLRTVNGAFLRPEVDRLFLHGPIIFNEGPYPKTGRDAAIGVYFRNSLNMTLGPAAGTANLSRDMPFLKNLRGGGVARNGGSSGRGSRDLGRFNYALRHVLLENRWEFYNMGYGWNEDRRLRGWYNFENSPSWQSESQRFQQADSTMTGFGGREQLAVMDRDDELMSYFRTIPGNCFPRNGGCTVDAASFRQQNLPRVIEQIQGPRGGGQGGFPECLANMFLRMYRQQLQALMALQNPPPAEVARLQQLIQQLQQFVGSLS